MKDLIERLPKVELHLHIEGTLEPELMLTLAERNQVPLPYKNLLAVQQAYHLGLSTVFRCLSSPLWSSPVIGRRRSRQRVRLYALQ